MMSSINRVLALIYILATALAKPATHHLTDAPLSLSNDMDRLANCSGGTGDDMRLHQVTLKKVKITYKAYDCLW